jgi:hypothetical protein
MMPSKLRYILLALLLIGCDRSEPPAAATETSMESFATGQVWTYDTRPGEEASRIIICRVETDANLGEIVHIHVRSVRLRNKHAPGGYSETVGHMPYSGDALRKSLVTLESSSVKLPAFEDGYREWRSSFENG